MAPCLPSAVDMQFTLSGRRLRSLDPELPHLYDPTNEICELMARWSMSEFERSHSLRSRDLDKLERGTELAPAAPVLNRLRSLIPDAVTSLIQAKIKLLDQLTGVGLL